MLWLGWGVKAVAVLDANFVYTVAMNNLGGTAFGSLKAVGTWLATVSELNRSPKLRQRYTFEEETGPLLHTVKRVAIMGFIDAGSTQDTRKGAIDTAVNGHFFCTFAKPSSIIIDLGGEYGGL